MYFLFLGGESIVIGFPDEQDGLVAVVLFHFFSGQDQVFYPAVHQSFSFFDQGIDKGAIEPIAYKGQVDDAGIFTNGKVASKKSGLQVADLRGDLVDDLIDANEFLKDGMDIVKQRMLNIGKEHFFISFGRCREQSC